MSTLAFPAHRVRHAYSGATEDWLASAAGQAVIVDSGDVWGVVASQEKSTSGLPLYSLVWFYDATGQRPEKGGVVTVDPSHPSYATFVEQLRTEGTVVSLEDSVAFARGQWKAAASGTKSTSRRPSSSSGGRRAAATGGSTGGAPLWQNPWVVGGGIALVFVVAGTAVALSGEDGK